MANEVGIRLALGADRRQIILMFLAESAAVLSVVLTVGVAVAIVAGRFCGIALVRRPAVRRLPR